ERPSEQELHRQVVHAFRIDLLVRPLRSQPTLRHDVPDRPGRRLEAVRHIGRLRIQDAVEDQMALVEGILGTRELEGSTPTVLAKLAHALRHTASHRACALRRCPPQWSAHHPPWPSAPTASL